MLEVNTQTDKRIKVLCEGETDVLKEVILGYPDNFHVNPQTIEVVNETQKKFYGSEEKPIRESLVKEFSNFKYILEALGVKVHSAKLCPLEANVPDQLTPRDIGFVIGDTFFISNMARKSRKFEYLGIQQIIDQISPNKVVRVAHDVIIEGGDIIVDKGYVFVGISQRTNQKGFEFLKSALSTSKFILVPIQLKGIHEGEDCLHLDCVFNPVGERHALIYPPGFSEIPDEIRKIYQWINVSHEEQSQLATNILSISDDVVISRDSLHRINTMLSDLGIKVYELSFDEAPKTGGSFRCCTLPLRRGIQI